MKVEHRKGCHEFSLCVAVPAAGPDKEGGWYSSVVQRAHPLVQQHECAHVQTPRLMGKVDAGGKGEGSTGS